MIDLNNPDFKINHWGVLYYYDYDLENLLIAEKRIIENSEKYSKTLMEEFRNKIKNDSELQTPATNEQELAFQAQYYGHYYGDTEKFLKQIPQNFRKASLLSIFSVLEGQLKLITNLIENNYKFSVKIKHITGTDHIHKYWIYLTKVYEIESKEVENEYNLIRQHKYIRNKIAHNNSEIDDNKITFIKNTKGLNMRKFGANYIVEIESEKYIIDIIELIQSFFNNLIKAIDRRYGELENVG